MSDETVRLRPIRQPDYEQEFDPATAATLIQRGKWERVPEKKAGRGNRAIRPLHAPKPG